MSEEKVVPIRSNIDVAEPFVSFSFHIVMNGTSVARCSAIDGLSREVEMIEYRDSANPRTPMFRQGRAKAPRITIKRALIMDGESSPFFKLLEPGEGGVIPSANIDIYFGLYGNTTTPANYVNKSKNSWTLTNCRPVKWSVSSFDGTSNALVVENIELVAEEITMKGGKE